MRWPWQKKQALALPSGDVAKVVSPGFSSASPGPATKPSGGDGVPAPGGFLFSGERDYKLVGVEKWKTYDNMTLNVAIIASAINVWTQLAGSAKWTAQPNPRGGKDAQRAADIVTEGLIEAQMSKPWRAVVRRQVMKKFRGFAMHEAVIRRRPDGMIVMGDLQHRPQWSIQRWDKPDEQTPWRAVEQWSRFGDKFLIPRERLLYSVEDTLSDSPDGVGLLRMLAEPVRILELYQKWEGIGFQTDLRGMPIARAPLRKLKDDAVSAGAKTPDEIKAYIQAQVQFLTDFLNGKNKTPEQGITLDSEPYRSTDAARTPSSIYEWAFDIVKGASSSMPEVGTAIGRIVRDTARIMCAEWLLLGGEDSGGAYSMHEDKTAMFGLVVNSSLEDVADDATRDVAARLTALNGMDPELCTPRLVPEPVASGSVKEACQSLQLLGQAGLHPEDKAVNVLRGRMRLPDAPEIDTTDWLLPRGAVVVPQADPVTGGGGAPTPGEKPPTPKPGAGGEAGQTGNVNARPEAAKEPPK